MSHYQCSHCSYIYKPERGDWTHEIQKNTRFEELPEDWRCPTCNQPKVAFKEIKR